MPKTKSLRYLKVSHFLYTQMMIQVLYQFYKMVNLKVFCLLVLTFCVMGLHLADPKQLRRESRSIIFRTPTSLEGKQQKIIQLQGKSGQWAYFPGLGGDFPVPFDQQVIISYSIQVTTSSETNFLTKVLIDGVEDDRFRSISPVGSDHSHFISLPVYLDQGDHKVQLLYSSDSQLDFLFIVNNSGNAYLEVDFLKD